MAVTPDHLVIAGAPDIVDADDPLGAFEARKGGRVWILSKVDGRRLSEHELDSPTVFHGVSVARGRLALSLANGQVVSLAGAKP